MDITVEMQDEDVIGTGRSVGEEDNRVNRNVPMLEGLNGHIQVGLNSERPP